MVFFLEFLWRIPKDLERKFLLKKENPPRKSQCLCNIEHYGWQRACNGNTREKLIFWGLGAKSEKTRWTIWEKYLYLMVRYYFQFIFPPLSALSSQRSNSMKVFCIPHPVHYIFILMLQIALKSPPTEKKEWHFLYEYMRSGGELVIKVMQNYIYVCGLSWKTISNVRSYTQWIEMDSLIAHNFVFIATFYWYDESKINGKWDH